MDDATSGNSGPTLGFVDSLRMPLVVEWRRGKNPPKSLLHFKSQTERIFRRTPIIMVLGGVALLTIATFREWDPRWAEPASEAGTALAVVGLLAVNLDLTRTRKARALWYVVGLLLGAAGCAAVLLGRIGDERWITLVSHLAVGMLAFVVLETFFVSAFVAARHWSQSITQELVLTIGPNPNIEVRERT